MKIKFVQKNISDIEITISSSTESEEIKKLIAYIKDYRCDDFLLVGEDNKVIKTTFSQIAYFYTEKYIVYAKEGKKTYKTKYRIYELEKMLPSELFVKINQGVIANIKQIKSVSPCINGTMKIEFINSDVQYASRRSVKKIKEKIGL